MNKKITKKVAKKTAKAPVSKKKIEIKKPIKTTTKKSIVKKKSALSSKIKKKIEEEEISENDSKLLEESFELIKTLNTQVGNVKDAKERLQEDMNKLNSRLTKHEETTKTIFNSKFILTIKEEIIKEFTPILNRIDFKNVKVDVFKEIEQIIEIEVQKLKTEFDSKSRKNNSDFAKNISELEIRVVDALKSNENIKKELKKFEKKEVSIILTEFETKIHSSLQNTTEKALTIFNTTSKDIELFRSDLKEQKKISSELSKNIENFKIQIQSLVSKDGVDLTSIESKIIKLEKELLSHKSLIEKYENDLYNRKKNETLDIETKVKTTLKETENALNKIKIEKKAEQDFMISKVNSLIDNINSFESKLQKIEKTSSETIDKQITKKVESLKENIQKTIEKNNSELNNNSETKLGVAITGFNAEKKALEKDLEIFKIEVSTLIKNYISELDSELKLLKSLSLNYKNEKEKDQTANKTKTALKQYEEQIKKINEENKIIKKALEVELQMDITDHLNASKEEISKQIISLNDFLTKITTENKEDKRNITEDIESKFVLSKNQFETEFKAHLESFDTEIKAKENEFLTKLNIIEDDKNEMLKELNAFKVDLTSLTKNYVTKLDEELKYIKKAELSFDEKKNEFVKNIDGLITLKKAEIEDYSEILKNNVQTVLTKQSEQFEIHENTFRDIFNEKVTTLSENTKKRLDTLDKKFLDKNIKVIDDIIKENKIELKIIGDELNSKSIELDKRLEAIEKKEADFYSQLDSEIHSFNQKSEERLNFLEKQFNKRFLEYDSNFSNFKGTIIDEVEDLIKEVNSIMQIKIANFDKNTAKLSFINNEASNKLNEFRQVQEILENEIRDTKEEVKDLKIKFEIVTPQVLSLTEHIRYMSEYETQLLALVKSLKNKGISDSSIKVALVNKGHPRFYVTMILENYNEIMNY